MRSHCTVRMPHAPVKQMLAKRFRAQMTSAEQLLWNKLRHNGCDGFHFRRQHVIAGFIVDFCCCTGGLVIEADGEVHEQQAEADRQRDCVLQSLGFRVLRVSNSRIFTDIDAVIYDITSCLLELES